MLHFRRKTVHWGFSMVMASRTRLIEEKRKQLLEQEAKLKATENKINPKIAVISGKGGVDKNTICANLAITFASHGHANHIGMLDADIHGSSITKILGLTEQRLQTESRGILPVSGSSGIEVASIDFLLPSTDQRIGHGDSDKSLPFIIADAEFFASRALEEDEKVDAFLEIKEKQNQSQTS